MAESTPSEPIRLNVLHFNDVYEVSKAPKFAAILKEARKQVDRLNPKVDTLVLFSGDFLSPSPMSVVTLGSHMVRVLNALKPSAGCVGNHEWDFGIEHGTEEVKKCSFPMLNANVFIGQLPGLSPESLYGLTVSDERLKSELALEQLMGGTEPFTVLNLKQSGLKIGVFSVSEDWTDLLPLPWDEGYTVLDPVRTAQVLVDRLRSEEYGCRLIIALTHSRLPSDLDLCEKVTGLDLVLGGHDHGTHAELVGGQVCLVKSGTDFDNLSCIIVDSKPDRSEAEEKEKEESLGCLLDALTSDHSSMSASGKGLRFRHWLLDLTSKKGVPDWEVDPEMEQIRIEESSEFERRMGEVVGEIHADLDCRFETVRTRESNIGNLISDVIRSALKVDCVQICGGALRYGGWVKGIVVSSDSEEQSDPTTIPTPPTTATATATEFAKLTMKDVMKIVPFTDPIIVIRVKGSTIRRALEHAVSGLPKLEGRFPQVSGLRFVFDPDLEPGHRLLRVWVSRWRDPSKTTVMKKVQKDDDQVLLSSSKRGSTVASGTTIDEEREFEDESLDDDNDDDPDSTTIWEDLNDDDEYSYATRLFFWDAGGDGFGFLKEETIEVVRGEDESWTMSFLFRNFLWCVSAVNDLIAKESEVTQMADDDDVDGDEHFAHGTGTRRSAESASSEDEFSDAILVTAITKPGSYDDESTPKKKKKRTTLSKSESPLSPKVVRKMDAWSLGPRRSSSIRLFQTPGRMSSDVSGSAYVKSADDEDGDGDAGASARDARNIARPLRIAPPITDYRIMRPEDYERFKDAEERDSDGIDGLFKRLPSFVSLDHRPRRMESLRAFGEDALLDLNESEI